LVFSELPCCLGEVAIDGKSLWRFPHISAIFAEVNATVKTIGKVQLEHYDNYVLPHYGNKGCVQEGQHHRLVGDKCCHEEGISFGTYDSR
jgi:hypothetical protein